MEKKIKIDLLCWLTRTKENKSFYQKHNKEINKYIKVLKESIESDRRSKGRKINPIILKEYATAILRLITDYFLKNNTS